MSHRSWDIFCTVIDNFGDIGVAWRLARRLAHGGEGEVRLWVDDLSSFARIAPELDPMLDEQTLGDIQVRRWRADGFPADVVPRDVVIEAFGCRLPECFEAAMAARTVKPVWINLEYLSAEDWTLDCHLLPSPHPRLPLTKHFFFPGFSPRSGGLICEDGLIADRRAWQADTLKQRALWQLYGVPEKRAGELRVSLFAYENPAATDLLAAWALGERRVSCLVPAGKVLADVEKVAGCRLAAGQHVRQGNLDIYVLPMTDQDGYDLTLWSCDFNFVRGEDSLVRAQWAGRPMAWHIYPQDDEAHIAKLEAFLSQYCDGLPAEAAAAIRGLNLAWNRGQDMAAAWRAAEPFLELWQQHSQNWPEQLLKDGDLLARLLHFVSEIG